METYPLSSQGVKVLVLKFKPLTTNVPPRVEISQLTGF